MRQEATKAYGFTLIELIIVIAIVAILSVVAVPRFPVNLLRIEYDARALLTDIRYAQMLSMATGERYYWVRNTANTYFLINHLGVVILLPSGSYVHTFSGNTVFAGITNLPNNYIGFDSQGTPYINNVIPGTPLAAAATITLSGSGQSRSIQISPGTGFGTLI